MDEQLTSGPLGPASTMVVLVIAGKLLAVLGLVAANGFFVAAEFSLVSIRRTRVEELASGGSRTAALLLKAIDALDSNLAATQLGVTISSLALGWIGEPALARLIQPAFGLLPGRFADVGSHAAAVALAFALITTFHIVLGELAPKSFALQLPESTAMMVVRPLRLFRLVFSPAILVLNGMGNSVVRLFGLEPGSAENRLHSTDELKLLVNASKEGGLIEPAQQEVVERAFDMGKWRVRSIMTPRVDVQWINAEKDAAGIMGEIRGCRHEQAVVARGTLDQFIGILRKQDLLDAHLDGQPLDPIGSVRDPIVVHDGSTVLQVLETFKDRPVQMAIVVDEYGAVRGIVTQTDLLEALAGEIPDGDEPSIVEREDGSFLVDGAASIHVVFDRLTLDLQGEKPDYQTIAGLVLTQFGRIPAVGDSVAKYGWRFEIVDMDGHRVDKVLMQRGMSG